MRHARASERDVTFLFTDIEGSTRLLQELGDGYAEALAEHRRLLREAFERYGGVEVDTQGDAFFVVFERAGDAVAAAAEGQQALTGSIRVRMGLHTGEPIVTDEGYVGLEVHRAARICAVSHGGQLVLSQATQALLDGDRTLTDLGLHRLKDLAEPVRLFQLGSAEFPPLRSLNATNLPAQPMALVGRERELTDVLELLGSARLVTLTGAGGSGKTRLALQVAADLVEEFKDGVLWVSLAALAEPDLVLPTIGATVGAKQELAPFVDEKRMLLLLDNLEQILDCASGLAELLHSCPNLKLLVTSRAPLRITGEQEYEVPPLPQTEAVELFVQRARQAKPGFEPDDWVAEVCRRLDGLPLAVELAAARIKLLSSQQILRRLGSSLDLLTAGRRDLPKRQQTLRAAIEWSYELLSETEKQLFAGLAAFAGSFDLDASAEVCAADLETLAGLMDQSLLRRTGEERFFMLETIHQFAVEQLDERQDEAVRMRHAEYFLQIAERLTSKELEREQRAAFERLAVEHDNMRAALATFSRAGAAELELRLASALAEFWVYRGFLQEGRERLEAALTRTDGQDSNVRLKALADASDLAHLQGDADSAAAFARQSLELARSLGDEAAEARSLHELGEAALVRGDVGPAQDLFEEAVEVGHKAGLPAANSIGNLGLIAFGQQDYERAQRLMTEAHEIFRAQGRQTEVAVCLSNLGSLAVQRGRREEAQRLLREGLELCRELELTGPMASCLETAALAVASARPSEAARLFGAADILRERINAVADPADRRLRQRAIETLESRIGRGGLSACLAEGSQMTAEQAVDLALRSLD